VLKGLRTGITTVWLEDRLIGSYDNSRPHIELADKGGSGDRQASKYAASTKKVQ